MPRKQRIQFPGAIYHVTTRGNDKQPIFLSDDDRREFLNLIGKIISEYRWICHAYCIMNNHYHLLVETKRGNLSEGMQQLNGSYCHYFNDKYGRVGHVTQGRYFARLVKDNVDMFTLFRYILLNPIKDGFADNPSEWPWSSYGATAGLVQAPEFLEVSYTRSLFSEKPELGKEAFVLYVEEGMNSGAGSLHKFFGRANTSRERNDAIRKARRAGFSVQEIAEYLGIHPATVYRALKS